MNMSYVITIYWKIPNSVGVAWGKLAMYTNGLPLWDCTRQWLQHKVGAGSTR